MPPPSKPPYKSGYSHLGLYLCRLLPFCTPWSESAGQSEEISADTIYILALYKGMDVRGSSQWCYWGAIRRKSRSVFSTKKWNTSGGLLSRKTLMCRTTTEMLSGILITKQ